MTRIALAAACALCLGGRSALAQAPEPPLADMGLFEPQTVEPARDAPGPARTLESSMPFGRALPRYAPRARRSGPRRSRLAERRRGRGSRRSVRTSRPARPSRAAAARRAGWLAGRSSIDAPLGAGETLRRTDREHRVLALADRVVWGFELPDGSPVLVAAALPGGAATFRLELDGAREFWERCRLSPPDCAASRAQRPRWSGLVRALPYLVGRLAPEDPRDAQVVDRLEGFVSLRAWRLGEGADALDIAALRALAEGLHRLGFAAGPLFEELVFIGPSGAPVLTSVGRLTPLAGQEDLAALDDGFVEEAALQASEPRRRLELAGRLARAHAALRAGGRLDRRAAAELPEEDRRALETFSREDPDWRETLMRAHLHHRLSWVAAGLRPGEAAAATGSDARSRPRARLSRLERAEEAAGRLQAERAALAALDPESASAASTPFPFGPARYAASVELPSQVVVRPVVRGARWPDAFLVPLTSLIEDGRLLGADKARSLFGLPAAPEAISFERIPKEWAWIPVGPGPAARVILRAGRPGREIARETLAGRPAGPLGYALPSPWGDLRLGIGTVEDGAALAHAALSRWRRHAQAWDASGRLVLVPAAPEQEAVTADAQRRLAVLVRDLPAARRPAAVSVERGY